MIQIDQGLKATDLQADLERMWALSGEKIRSIESHSPPECGAPVITIKGRYTPREWTEWTRGFQYGSALLHFDATGDEEALAIGRRGTLESMAVHLTHMGVHDHGFTTVSTYGNLWRLLGEGRVEGAGRERELCELALRCSGAVQARRWTPTADERGFIYSFNGPHSLFADTIRTLRAPALAHMLGQVLVEDGDERIVLLQRVLAHAATTARHAVYYGEGRDRWDVRGRVAHESLFNANDGRYRCPSTQQGYSPFSTWTRALAWIMLGFAELLEYLAARDESELEPHGGRASIEAPLLRAARASCDYYIESSPSDGIPYWDTAAPGLVYLGDYRERPAEPYNEYEPVDSSAAAIASQGLLRLGRFLGRRGEEEAGARYHQAGLTVLRTLLRDPYLASAPGHEGLILHSVYHHPKGWDHIPPGSRIPHGESSMWGDYHAREVALYVQRIIRGQPYLSFFGSRP